MAISRNILNALDRFKEHVYGKTLVIGYPDLHGVPYPNFKSLFRMYGCEAESLDIHPDADIRLNLNFPLPEDFKTYDVVIDNGTLEHVCNAQRAAESALRMVKVGGAIIILQGFGDCTNAGFWTFSPNYYPTFFEANGCKTIGCYIFDDKGHFAEYKPRRWKKSESVGSIIPFRCLFGYYSRLIRWDLRHRLLNSSNSKLRNLPRLFEILHVPFLQRLLDFLLAKNCGPQWNIIFCAVKEKETEITYPAQPIYSAWS